MPSHFPTQDLERKVRRNCPAERAGARRARPPSRAAPLRSAPWHQAWAWALAVGSGDTPVLLGREGDVHRSMVPGMCFLGPLERQVRGPEL